MATGICYAQEPRLAPQPSRPLPERRTRDVPLLPRARRDVYVEQYHPTKSENKLLEPAREDVQTFAEFVRPPESGLIRIFPARGWRVVSVDQLESGQSPGFVNFASRYSFTKTKHGHSLQGYVDPSLGWAEIKFDSDMLTTAFTRSSVGLLVSLGDVPLQTITETTPGASAIAEFQAPRNQEEERRYIHACREGFELHGFVYRSSLPATVNNTYVLRSINNKRADILVALRIVRADENGSLTMLWKRLKVNPKPSWKRKG
ncbi:MAG TPA: hypothetical protein VLA93_20735 [Pyrinomonadaceae bacterium]|nr:hypothetical protein [Pyrinomonadaceae bacterium]